MNNEIGSLEVGKQADYVVFDLNHSSFFPLNHVVNQLVYSAHTSAITEVVVGGKTVLNNGLVSQIDEIQILEELRQESATIQQKIATTIPLGKAMKPYLKKAYSLCMADIRNEGSHEINT